MKTDDLTEDIKRFFSIPGLLSLGIVSAIMGFFGASLDFIPDKIVVIGLVDDLGIAVLAYLLIRNVLGYLIKPKKKGRGTYKKR